MQSKQKEQSKDIDNKSKALEPEAKAAPNHVKPNKSPQEQRQERTHIHAKHFFVLLNDNNFLL